MGSTVTCLVIIYLFFYYLVDKVQNNTLHHRHTDTIYFSILFYHQHTTQCWMFLLNRVCSVCYRINTTLSAKEIYRHKYEKWILISKWKVVVSTQIHLLPCIETLRNEQMKTILSSISSEMEMWLWHEYWDKNFTPDVWIELYSLTCRKSI